MVKRTLIGVLLVLGGCDRGPEPVAPLYDVGAVEPRTIEINVEAAGVIEPEATVEVKSKASGEILTVHAETGDVVEAGKLLVEIDPRTPSNRVAEAEAALKAAIARRTIAQTQMQRSSTLFDSGTLTQSEFEQTQLEFANAEAQVVSSEVAVENARISLDDTDVRAPITGTIIEKAVEPGMVITSPSNDVSGGTVLMQMADLNAVRVRTLVDETDIGKIRPGMPATVTVAAYPNQPFSGEVLKIEPLAIVEQNVTMFAVLVRLDNRDGLLKPGMNADVEIEIASREDVPSVPTAALRTDGDIAATAVMLGLDEARLRAMLDAKAPAARGDSATLEVAGRQVELPAGVDAARVRELIDKRRGGGISPYRFGGEYWVVAVRGGRYEPVTVRTGLTDLANTEVVAGLDPGDQVLLLPSTSLFEQQARLQEFISQRFSSTPFQQQQGGRIVIR